MKRNMTTLKLIFGYLRLITIIKNVKKKSNVMYKYN